MNNYIYICTAEEKARYAPKLVTDEALQNNGTWGAVTPDGEFMVEVAYRRKIKTEWKEFAKEKPKDNESVWIFTVNKNIELISHFNSHYPYSDVTHWQPATIPAPPIIKEPWEVACINANYWHPDEELSGYGKVLKAAFKAGFNAGRDSK